MQDLLRKFIYFSLSHFAHGFYCLVNHIIVACADGKAPAVNGVDHIYFFIAFSTPRLRIRRSRNTRIGIKVTVEAA